MTAKKLYGWAGLFGLVMMSAGFLLFALDGFTNLPDLFVGLASIALVYWARVNILAINISEDAKREAEAKQHEPEYAHGEGT